VSNAIGAWTDYQIALQDGIILKLETKIHTKYIGIMLGFLTTKNLKNPEIVS